MRIAGDISLAEAVKKLEARFGAWKKAGTPMPKVTDPEAITKPEPSLVGRPNSVQTSLIVGTQAIRRTDADFCGGDGDEQGDRRRPNRTPVPSPARRERLHLRRRIERRRAAVGAACGWRAPSVRNEVTEPALTDLLDEIRQMREVRVPGQGVRGCEAVAGRGVRARAGIAADACCSKAITRWRYGLPADYWDRYPERIMAITEADAQAMAKKYLDPSRLQIVAVGNEEAVARTLRKLGAVDVYDAGGTKVRAYRAAAAPPRSRGARCPRDSRRPGIRPGAG